MKITKIKIKNLFGISEYEADGKSVELIGDNGTGKTSVIDAIRLALTNQSDRKYVIKNGNDSGEIIVEMDSGITINRKIRANQSDYKSIKRDGKEVQSPESFLRELFVPLQLQPVEFMEMKESEQNAIILNMIKFDWDLNWIREQFGEIPQGVDYSQNILCVLNDIQSDKGDYYLRRQDINRDRRNKQAFVADIAESIPDGYDVEKWEAANLSEIYTKIERIRKENGQIEEAKRVIENRDNKVRSFEAEREIALSALEQETAATRTRLEKDIEKLKAQISSHMAELETLEEKKQSKAAVIKSKYEANVAKYDAEVEQYKEYSGKEITDYSELQREAATIEEMKSHINEYKRMKDMEEEIECLIEQSNNLTEKIELARELPGIILKTAEIPIKNLTVVDGIPLINGLPISNLSEGEKLNLCIDVAIQNQNGLQIVLIDGVEKLSKKNRETLYAKCKEKGLQFISTRTTDDEDLTVIEL